MKQLFAVFALCFAMAACTAEKSPSDSTSAAPAAEKENAGTGKSCVIAGCSKELCLSAEKAEGLMSTCQWKDEYRCAQMMTCELQADGECGFTPNEKSEACLKELPQEPASL
ncbi:MAG: hypothetical protein KF789_08840 [Bdellovibrionaceae bacterium]|nr:hypothetical protein [Pseudobdellovibrionaceae bacterium]